MMNFIIAMAIIGISVFAISAMGSTYSYLDKVNKKTTCLYN